MNLEKLAVVDPELEGYIREELTRQRDKIELIASENIVTPAVMEAMGSILTNKYAEGYPGHRYYGGCEYVDKVEALAIERAKKLFNAKFANVQAHCGANTNLAVYFAFLKPGDTIMGMNLSQGGHLSHGSSVNISGTYFKVVPYGVNPETELIDYDEMERIALESQPKMIVALPPALILALLILNALLKLPTRLAHCFWLTWHILPVLLLQVCIPARFPMLILLLLLPIKPCVVPVVV